VQTVEYLPYTPKTINTLKIVPSSVEYGLKYTDRSALDALLSSNPDVDEVLIEKEGYITDTTIANVAFYDGKRWVTPQKPLLNGTMRAKLIDEGFLHPAPIKKEDLSSFKQVALMNAMIGFNILNHFNIH
jgi:4-amino-4-deoxychorismate lyase